MFLLIPAVAAGLFVYHKELALLWESIKSGETPPIYLIAGFIILPVFGFPILPLLILMGVRFGAIIGSTLVLAMIPLHLAVSFRLTNDVLRKPIEKMVKKRALEIPGIPGDYRFKYSMWFMIMPGLSYSLKNYILPLSGLPFVPFMVCGWVTQGLLSIPFIVLGDAASQWSVTIFASIVGLYAIFLIFGRQLTSLYRRFRGS